MATFCFHELRLAMKKYNASDFSDSGNRDEIPSAFFIAPPGLKFHRNPLSYIKLQNSKAWGLTTYVPSIIFRKLYWRSCESKLLHRLMSVVPNDLRQYYFNYFACQFILQIVWVTASFFPLNSCCDISLSLNWNWVLVKTRACNTKLIFTNYCLVCLKLAS